MNNLFDENGRCIPNNIKSSVYKETRRYFIFEPQKINYENIYNRIKKHLDPNTSLSIDEFKQGKDSSWSQLLIGLFSKPSSGTQPDITNGDANQWGIGAAFMTGVEMTRTMLMYDLGFYVQWHSEPDKGQFENK